MPEPAERDTDTCPAIQLTSQPNACFITFYTHGYGPDTRPSGQAYLTPALLTLTCQVWANRLRAAVRTGQIAYTRFTNLLSFFTRLITGISYFYLYLYLALLLFYLYPLLSFGGSIQRLLVFLLNELFRLEQTRITHSYPDL